MNHNFSPAMLGEGWNMLKHAERDQYFLVAPETQHQDMRLVLIEIMTQLLAGKHIAMLAQSHTANSLGALRALSPETRILKRGNETALFAELGDVPSAEMLCALPRTGAFRLRFAGFDGSVPGELIFSGLIENECPADIVLDCTYLAGRPALGITLAPEQMDEEALVDLVRHAVADHGAALRIDFAS